MLYIAIALIIYLLYYWKNNYYNIVKVGAKHTNKEESVGNKSCYLAMILLILVAGLRGINVGYDLENYRANFDIIAKKHNISKGHGFELGFQIITFIVSLLFKGDFGFTLTLIIFASIIIICTNFAAKRLSPNITLTMFLFVCLDAYLRGFDQIRQMLAVSIIMVAFVYAFERKPIKFIAFCILAALFHKIALIFLPFYILVRKDFKYIHYILILLLGGIFIIFNEQLIKILSIIFNLDFYQNYILTDYGIQDFTLIGYLEVASLVAIFLFFLIYKIIYEKKFGKLKDTYRVFLDLFFCAAIFAVISLLMQRPEHYGRLIYYFFWALIFLIPEFLDTIKNKNIKLIFKIAIIIVALLYLCCSLFVIDAHGVNPYKLFWN